MSERSIEHHDHRPGTRMQRISAIPTQLDSIIIPKRRSSLQGTISGNSAITQTTLDGAQVETVSRQGLYQNTRSESSVEDLEDLTTKISALGIDKRPPLPKTLYYSPELLVTPKKSSKTMLDVQTPTTSPYDKNYPGSILSTPIKRRAVNYGKVVDTTPSSQDRFIPNRRHFEDYLTTFKVNKPFYELTPVQKQMRINGIISDPFTARRVTPQSNNRSEASNGTSIPIRATSAGDIWTVGGLVSRRSSISTINAGRGVSLGSGTTAPVFKANFFDSETAQESHERYEGRLAEALEIDRAATVLNFGLRTSETHKPSEKTTVWKDDKWVSNQPNQRSAKCNTTKLPKVPRTPFKVLDAPSLRDDFYCSVLAYDTVYNILAVGLKNYVYLWSEARGVQQQIRDESSDPNCHVTSLSFSSAAGGKSILAIGRSDGRVALWRHGESGNRIVFSLRTPIACLAFKPVLTKRFSRIDRAVVPVEELLVGDKLGNIYYFCVEWPLEDFHRNKTSMAMLAKLAFHAQQVCSLTWSPDGQYFASGGNDNICFLMATRDILNRPDQLSIPAWPVQIGRERARHRWPHAAAIKAIAFCPWQKGLIATGGGSNDRAIHFFHTGSGACLATIKVYAQVTSLIWSRTRREICATFGYAQPDHPFRIAVFTWPGCEQVLRIKWNGNMRALYAIPYPGGPNEESNSQTKAGRKGRAKDAEGGTWWSRTKEEGCIVVASSDESVKFHEVWSGQSSGMGSRRGGLAWSSILESEEGGDIGVGSNEIIR